MIRPVRTGDAAALCRIYNHYVLHTTATFEERIVTADEMARRIEVVTASQLSWFVAELETEIAGYAYASPWKGRSAYRYSVESTVYLDRASMRRGLGTALYERLVEALRTRGMHAALGGIALPNEASVALHEKMGFRKVAHLEQVGRKFDRWIDVGYWQLLL